MKQLSDGQKARIVFAKLAMDKPHLLMLDEPTSALDPASAELVEDSLRQAAKERSVVVITHKIAQAALCDRIVVLEQGRVIEEGMHAALVAKRGRYYEMLVQGTGGSSDEQQ